MRIHGPPPDARTICDVLRWRATQSPEQRAFVLLDRGERESGSLTFAELDARARVIAHALQDRALAGRPVVLAYPTCLEFIAAVFACTYAGAIAVPSPIATRGYGAERLKAILSDVGAATILTLASARNQPGATPAGHYLATDEIPNDIDPAPQWQPTPSEIALLQYTSGSTGGPRGVVLTHANVMSNQHALAAVLHLAPGDNAVHWLPLYHDMGLIGGVFHSVYAGTTSFLIPPLAFLQKPARWLNAMHRYRATISMAPCFAYRLCSERVDSESAARLDLSSWRVAICGGEAIRPQWLEKFATAFGAAQFNPRSFLPAYGLAEATLIATAAPAGSGLTTYSRAAPSTGGATAESMARTMACCGLTVTDHRLAIVDPPTGRRVAPGAEGEIWLQGPSVAAGYWNQSDETRATFEAAITEDTESGRWLRTGDLGFLSKDGLVISGRIKETIVIRGVNYDPLDIETAAQESQSALAWGAASAFSVDIAGDEHLVLVSEVSRSGLKELDIGLVADTVVEAISRRFGLSLYDLVLLRPGVLPRTTSGKIRRSSCRQQYLAGELAALAAIDSPTLGRSRLCRRSIA